LTHNLSSHSITQVHIILLSTATSLDSSRKYPKIDILPGNSAANGPSYHHKQRQLLNESFYVSIPKNTRDITTICPFRVPSFCVPTTRCHFGKYIDISYEIVIILGDHHHFDKNTVITHPHAIRLPLMITTVPPSSTGRPPKLQIPFITAPTASATEENSNNDELPTFIKANESPLISPTSEGHSPGGIWSPGSPMVLTATTDDGDDDVIVDNALPPVVVTVTEDTSGHLMVPTQTSAGRRSASKSSS
jgi:hypothetical protein